MIIHPPQKYVIPSTYSPLSPSIITTSHPRFRSTTPTARFPRSSVIAALFIPTVIPGAPPPGAGHTTYHCCSHLLNGVVPILANIAADLPIVEVSVSRSEDCRPHRSSSPVFPVRVPIGADPEYDRGVAPILSNHPSDLYTWILSTWTTSASPPFTE
jgi:hypothetical protein